MGSLQFVGSHISSSSCMGFRSYKAWRTLSNSNVAMQTTMQTTPTRKRALDGHQHCTAVPPSTRNICANGEGLRD